MGLNTYIHTYKRTALAIALANIAASNLYANVDAGILNQEINQHTAEKVKPTGQVFNNQANTSHSQSNTNDEVQFTLNTIEVLDISGNAVAEDLSHITLEFINKPISLSDLNKLAQNITDFYRKNNYLVARAIIPPQDIENGKVKLTVIKGKIGQITIQNNSRLSSSFIQRISQTAVDEQVYVYKSDLEKLALLLNDLQGIKPNLAIKAGKEKGTTDITVSLEDGKRFGGYILVDNQGNKDTGQYRLSTGLQINNLIGFSDDLKLDFLVSNKSNLKSARLDYSGLIDGYGTKLGVIANYLDYKLGGNFKDLRANGKSTTLGAYILHPTIRIPDFRLNTKLAFNHQQLTDKQDAVNLTQKRKVNTVSLSTSGSWNSVKNGITYFSLNALFGRENNQTNEKVQYQSDTFKPNKSFTVFQYNLSHEQSLPKSFAFSMGVTGQIADKNLDSSQKMLLGGLSAVRGYKAGAVSVDEGHILQTELKHYLPLFKESILTTSVFYDYGVGKYYKDTKELESSVKNNVKVQSVGAGLGLSSINNYSINVTAAKTLGNKLADTDKHQIWLSAVKTF
ncbi:ShlB/FhaC/HecB family hemolysin secretion/activation protein [Ursidibacter arcticus]